MSDNIYINECETRLGRMEWDFFAGTQVRRIFCWPKASFHQMVCLIVLNKISHHTVWSIRLGVITQFGQQKFQWCLDLSKILDLSICFLEKRFSNLESSNLDSVLNNISDCSKFGCFEFGFSILVCSILLSNDAIISSSGRWQQRRRLP